MVQVGYIHTLKYGAAIIYLTSVTTGVGEPRWRRRRFFSGTLELGDQDASRPGQIGRRGRFLLFVIGAELSASEI
jgi:hypothetical protein